MKKARDSLAQYLWAYMEDFVAACPTTVTLAQEILGQTSYTFEGRCRAETLLRYCTRGDPGAGGGAARRSGGAARAPPGSVAAATGPGGGFTEEEQPVPPLVKWTDGQKGGAVEGFEPAAKRGAAWEIAEKSSCFYFEAGKTAVLEGGDWGTRDMHPCTGA